MSPKAKYKLHATKVDRIAIVDRPAVPDAEIVVFKRQKDIEIDSQQQKFYDEIDAGWTGKAEKAGQDPDDKSQSVNDNYPI